MKTKTTQLQQQIKSSFSVRFLLVALMLFSFASIQAQTTLKLSCTDVTKHSQNVDIDAFKDLKASWLGKVCTLTFYDRNLRFSFLEDDLVFDKTTATQYKYTTRSDGYNLKYIIQLNKVGKEIKSFKFTCYRDKTALFTNTFKILKRKTK